MRWQVKWCMFCWCKFHLWCAQLGCLHLISQQGMDLDVTCDVHNWLFTLDLIWWFLVQSVSGLWLDNICTFLVVGTEIPYCLVRFLTKARLSPYHLGWSSADDAPGHRAGSPFLTLVVDEHHQGELTFLFPSCYGANLSTRTLTSYLVICVHIWSIYKCISLCYAYYGELLSPS